MSEQPTAEQVLYAERDIEEQGEHYVRHVGAMTAEQLHAKSDIAAELAHRDIEIDRLRAALKRVVKTSEHYDLGSAYTAARHLDAVRTARNALMPAEETAATLVVDGVRHHSACACLHTPAGQCARRPCSCGASSKTGADNV